MKRVIRGSGSRAGQAIVEYILMITVALTIVSLLTFGFKKVLFKTWMTMACEITAPCPDCPTPPEVKSVGNRVAPGSCK